MAALPSLFRLFQSIATRFLQRLDFSRTRPRFLFSPQGVSLLDLLIAALVLVVVLLAAVSQFSTYEKSAERPASQAQAAEGQPAPPPQ